MENNENLTSQFLDLNLKHSKEELIGHNFVSKKPILLWKEALKKIKLFNSDPWYNFDLSELPTYTAIRHRYSAIRKKWVVDEITIKMETTSFDRGSMRECFRLKKASGKSLTADDWKNASNYVAKRYISAVDKQVYFDDVRLQMQAKLWGEAYNRQNPPKKIDIFLLSVIEVPNSIQDTNTDIPKAYYHIERYMEGEYRKYNSNSGFVDEQLRNTPQAFSHFTFERSGHRLLVVDIQGVGDLYTDPQIHTSDGIGYSDGNLGLRGMALFFHTHQCNPLCRWLGLKPFDLALSEQKLEYIQLQEEEKEEEVKNEFSASRENPIEITETLDSSVCKLNRHRRAVSFNDSSNNSDLFGPTVVCQNHCLPIFQRRRCTSSYDYYDVSIGSLLKEDATQLSRDKVFFHTDRQLLCCQDKTLMKSGDSGYSVSFSIPIDADNQSANIDSGHGYSESTSLSVSPNSRQIFVDEVLVDSFENKLLPSNRGNFRRQRNISESSDIDAEEHCQGSNSLYQLMHESHKPSCADHPTNLDQEIGQSILGQIHHELARLHEAGRFIPTAKGGWSYACLDALEMKEDAVQSQLVETPQQVMIDWEAVLFHEKISAQLGCLEAMIILAHYYLGLPTQLFSDCSIKPDKSALRLGIDYLGRAAMGGDRRCMILLAHYLDNIATRSNNQAKLTGLVIPVLQTIIDEKDLHLLPTTTSDAWLEAVGWYKRAVDLAIGNSLSGDVGITDEGFDAERHYDAAEDLIPVYRILGRMAEMYSVGGYGLPQSYSTAADLFNQAGELASSALQGRFAVKYFQLSEQAYAQAESKLETP